jgi:hypothetical protein
MRTGKFQLGICDRCGTQHLMRDLRRDGEQRGLLVCSECYDQRFRPNPRRDNPPPDTIRPDQQLE